MDSKIFIVPLALISGIAHGLAVFTTSWWLKSVGASYTKIGLFGLANLAYGFRLFWIPLFDKINLNQLLVKVGIRWNQPVQRKGFILICNICVSLGIYICSLADPGLNILSLAIPIVFTAFWAASSDSIMVAYMYETLKPTDMGLSTAFYRIGMFLAGPTSLFIYEQVHLSWGTLFQIWAIVIFILTLSIFLAPREKDFKPKTWTDSFVLPYKDIVKQYGIHFIVVVLFLVAYKARDRFCAPMEHLFLRNECSLDSIRFFLLKLISTFALAFSAVKAGPIIQKFKYKGSFLIAILANIALMIAYTLYSLKQLYGYIFSLGIIAVLFGSLYWLSKGKNAQADLSIFAVIPISILIFGNSIAAISAFMLVIVAKMISGIQSSLLYSYQNGLCSPDYILTQYTLISGLERISGGDWIQAASGRCVDAFGWTGFYIVSIIISMLPLLLIQYTAYPKIIQAKKPDSEAN